MKQRIIVGIILLLGVLSKSVGQQTTFVNPILSGFYPDPSVIKVGTDYYLINSTFAYFPGLPVFHSKDLKNWKQIGNVIDRPSQLNFMGDRMTRGLFAPSISYNNGVFYVVCTNIDGKGNFVVTAGNPAGPWSDPIWLPAVRGIDPSLFFDDDKAYIIYNSDAPDNKPLYSGHRTIRMYAFDPVKMTVTGEEKILVNGGVDISKKPVWIEGPHIMKANNWYYLYAAEGGTSVNHSEVVLRSRSAWGPYVPYENNPILTQRDLPADRPFPVTSAGHAQMVEGPDGKLYAIFLAVRPYSDNYYNTGRETFIAPVEWKDEWPVINPDSKEIKYYYTAGFKEVKQDARPQSGNFSYTLKFNKGLDPALLFMRTIDSSSFQTGKNGLTMQLKPETVMEHGNPAFIGKRQQHLNGSVETVMDFSAVAANEKAGLIVFQNESHFYYLCKSIRDGKACIQLYTSKEKEKEMELVTQSELPVNTGKVWLKIDAKSDHYDFYFGTKKNKWLLLKENMDARFLSTQVAGGFIGCMFGMYATSSGNATGNSVRYGYLKYGGNDPMYRTKN